MKQVSLRHAQAKSTLFFSSNWKWKAFPNSHNSPVDTVIYYIFAAEVYTKGGSKLIHKPTTRYMHSTVVPYSKYMYM